MAVAAPVELLSIETIPTASPQQQPPLPAEVLKQRRKL
jgi:hypothetical protein